MPFIVTPGLLKRRSEFYRELAALAAAGVPLIRALQQVQRRPPSRSYRGPLEAVIARITQGSTLTESLGSLRDWVPPFDLALMRAGEESGRLVECFRMLSQHYAERARLTEALIRQLLYPAFIFHFAALIFPPALLPKLVWEGQVVPFLLQKATFLAPVYAIVFLLVLAGQGRHGEWWRAQIERVLHPVPVLGRALREQALARLAAALEALIAAGVTIIEAWDLAAAASGSPAVQRAVHGWRPRVLAGELPSDQVSRSAVFPELFANLYGTGEVSGKLDEELRHLHDYYQDAARNRMQVFMRLLVGSVSLGVMLAIAYWIITFWVGYYGNILKEL
jgi:type II secretory pathway component PulF